MLTKEQLEMRRHGITGTDIGAILGRSEHRSALDVFREKKGLAEPLELTAALKRGIYLEDGIRRWYAADMGALQVSEPGTLVLAGEPRIMATPDGVALFGDKEKWEKRWAGEWERRGLEIKAPGPFMESGWGQPGTDEVPDAYLLQGVFEMAVLNVERLDFAALLGGELQVYPVRRNRELESWLIEYALRWWRDYVEAGKEPPPTARERDVEFIASKFPRATKPHLAWEELTPEQRLAVEELLAAEKALKAAKQRRVELELQAKLAFGEAGGVILPPEAHPATRIDWQTTKARPLRWSDALAEVRGVYEGLLLGGDVRSAPALDAILDKYKGENPRPFTIRTTRKGEE